MAANETHSLTANPSKASPSDCARDGRKTAHNDGSSDTTNKVTQNDPPNNKNAAQKGSPAKFLQWCHPKTPLDGVTLSQKWSYWYPRDMDEDRHPRDDPRPTWGDDPWGDAE